ncbi:hypothetical protein VNO78_10785 [Psophocarpus tetragonolobus]|uniref:Uncharacterized protein n=1 Tax=Psophocarpus tetragonolobus TaxID=3891 RepID=A0AAN9SMQ4_PSOTE
MCLCVITLISQLSPRILYVMLIISGFIYGYKKIISCLTGACKYTVPLADPTLSSNLMVFRCKSEFPEMYEILF